MKRNYPPRPRVEREDDFRLLGQMIARYGAQSRRAGAMLGDAEGLVARNEAKDSYQEILRTLAKMLDVRVIG